MLRVAAKPHFSRGHIGHTICPRGGHAARFEGLPGASGHNEEIIEVLNRPWIRDRYGLADRIFDVSFISWELSDLVIDPPNVRASSDPDDDKFVATAVAGRADYLVTGDVVDLLRLRKYGEVTIISPREFVSLLRL